MKKPPKPKAKKKKGKMGRWTEKILVNQC
jgi:hypothetical protein